MERIEIDDVKLEQYLRESRLMYFKIVFYDVNGKYVDEIDNYELKNYTMNTLMKYADYKVFEEQVEFRKLRGYTISTTIIHAKE